MNDVDQDSLHLYEQFKRFNIPTCTIGKNKSLDKSLRVGQNDANCGKPGAKRGKFTKILAG